MIQALREDASQSNKFWCSIEIVAHLALEREGGGKFITEKKDDVKLGIGFPSLYSSAGSHLIRCIPLGRYLLQGWKGSLSNNEKGFLPRANRRCGCLAARYIAITLLPGGSKYGFSWRVCTAIF